MDPQLMDHAALPTAHMAATAKDRRHTACYIATLRCNCDHHSCNPDLNEIHVASLS